MFTHDSSIARIVDRYREVIRLAGLKPGALLGCGSTGCVYESGPDRVFKFGFFPREVTLVRRIQAMDAAHPSIVRDYRTISLPHVDPALAPHFPGLECIERERLRFDHDRSGRALSLLSWVETYTMRGAKSLAKLVATNPAWPAERVITSTAKKLTEEEDYEANGDASPEAQADAVALLDALAWAYARGIFIGDLWAAGLGMGYGEKAENVGYRGNVPVIADLGVWQEVKP